MSAHKWSDNFCASPKELYGVRRELRENLGTKDPKIACKRAPEALTKLRAMLDRAERVASEEPVEPLPWDIAALAGDWYRKRVNADGSDWAQKMGMALYLELGGQDWPDEEIAGLAPQVAERLLKENSFAVTPDSVSRLAKAVERAAKRFRELLKQRDDGDWSPCSPVVVASGGTP
jgi:hypothetical protein